VRETKTKKYKTEKQRHVSTRERGTKTRKYKRERNKDNKYKRERNKDTEEQNLYRTKGI